MIPRNTLHNSKTTSNIIKLERAVDGAPSKIPTLKFFTTDPCDRMKIPFDISLDPDRFSRVQAHMVLSHFIICFAPLILCLCFSWSIFVIKCSLIASSLVNFCVQTKSYWFPSIYHGIRKAGLSHTSLNIRVVKLAHFKMLQNIKLHFNQFKP